MTLPRLWGHRGSPRLAPENTLASFDRALRDGAHGIEFDCQLTRDGVAVVIHDDALDRTTNGRGLVRDQDLADLRALDAGSWFAPRFRGERVPLLDEVLDLAAGVGAEVVLEIKDGRAEAIRAYVAAVARRRLFERVWFHSFVPADLVAVRSNAAHARIQLIGDCGQDLLGEATRLAANAFSPYDEALRPEQIDPAMVREARARNMELNAGLVNDPGLRAELGRRGVGAVFTDVPGMLAAAG